MTFTAQRALVRARPAALALLLLLSAFASASAEGIKEARLPGSPLGKLAASYLAAFNSGSRDALRGFISANYSPSALQDRSADSRAGLQAGFYRSLGSLSVYRVEQPSDDELLLFVRAKRSGEWMRLTFSAEPGTPPRLPGILFEPVSCPSRAECPTRLTDAQLVEELASYLETLSASGDFAGVVLLARDGTPLFEKAYGAGPGQIPHQLSSRFALASMGKMFVGVAVAQLAEQGKLSFHDPIRKFLPEQPRSITERVTIHHLLTHSSGLASFVDPEGYSQVQFLSVQDSLPVFFRKGLSFEPGERWQYSNAGYITLEAIVERVSGQTFSAYIEQHIFRPAGMTQTSGGFSTARDLLRFSSALRGNKLLNREDTANLLRPRIQTSWNGAHYGYGFAVFESHGQRLVGHAGAAPGWNGQLDVYWGSGYTVVVLANRDAPVAQRVAVRLRDLLNPR